MPPRVAIVPPVPVPYREPLFKALSERDRIAPHVVYLSGSQAGWDQPSGWFGEPAGYSSEVLSAWQRMRPGRSPVTVARGLGRALSRAAPDCVVSWEYGPATLRALRWCRRRGVPLVVFSELTPWSDCGLSRAQLRVHRLVAPRAAGFIVASSQGGERLRALGVPARRVEVALQSADLEPITASAREASERGAAGGAPPHCGAAPSGTTAGGARPTDGPVRVLSVGRLVPDKNLTGLIEAFAEAGFRDGEAELELRGSGPLADELRALAARRGVPVLLPGPVPPAELAGVYRSAHVHALASTYEPFGVALREAAAAGLPLIASRRAGATGDIAVEGENALVVDPDDRAEITDALRRLVREPELRERLARGSRAVTDRHPLAADAEAWERAVTNALRGRQGGSDPP